MKVAQNDETNPDTQPVRPPHTPNISNLQLFPSGSSVRKHETPGILPGCFPPFTGITYYRVRAHRTPRIVLLRFVMLWLLCYLLCSLPVTSFRWTRDCRRPPVRVRYWWLVLLARATRQAPPLITRYRLFFSLLLALELCSMLLLSVNPILLYSLSLPLLLLPLPAILNA